MNTPTGRRYDPKPAVQRFRGPYTAYAQQLAAAWRVMARREAVAREIGATVIMDEIILTPEQAVLFAERCKAEGL